MKPQTSRPYFLNHIVSASGLALFSTAAFLFAWSLPSETYSRLIGEPDYMHFDALTLLFFLLCVAGFFVGNMISGFLLQPSTSLESTGSNPGLGAYLTLPLIVMTLLTFYEAYKVFTLTPDFLALLLGGQGNAIKAELQVPEVGTIGLADHFQIGIVWWTYWRISNSSEKTPWNMFRRILIGMGVLAILVNSFVTMSRGGVIPVVVGLAILYLMNQLRRQKLSYRKLLYFGLSVFAGVAVIFMIFGISRGVIDTDSLLSSACGYTMASYNRLAALLQGKMRYTYGGHGVYISSFAAYSNTLNKVLPLRSTMHWPDFYDLWGSEFEAVQWAGLNSLLIWSGTFGYLFSDLGWGTPLMMMIYGVLYGFVWDRAKKGTAFGITVYPWFALSVVMWFSTNSLFDPELLMLLVTALALTLYEKTFKAKPTTLSQPDAL